VLKVYQEVLPKSNTHLRLLIDYLPAGPTFRDNLQKYMQPLIVKGVPSLINDLRKTIYTDKDKTQAVGDILQGMIAQMEKDMTLSAEDSSEQDPTVMLWLYYFMS
jgi:hypothetical protein